MNHKIGILSILPTLLIAPAGQAQDSHSGNTYRADPVMVTASRTAQHQSEALSATIVIDRQEIERLQPESISDLLRGRAGIAVSNNGGLGKNTSIFLRGTNSNQTLFLIDGVRFSSATTGAAAIQDIPIEQIERIEIVKGPRSSLYGADAIGGVIQIFTRDGKQARGLQPSFSASYGSNDLTRVTGGLSGGDGDSWFSANVSQLNSNGFDTCGGRFNDRPNCSAPADLDDDGYENQSINLRAGHRFGDLAEIDLTVFQANGENEYDPADTRADISQQILSSELTLSPTDFWDISVRAGRSQDESENFSNGASSGEFNTERYDLSLQNDFKLPHRQLVTLGTDYYNESVDSTTTFEETSRHNVAGFGQYIGHWNNHSIQGSVRVDDNEAFGSEVTGDVAYGYDINRNVKLFASYGTAFKAPTFNDLYIPLQNFGTPTFPFFFSGNPDLKPETSETYEIGAKGEFGRYNWSINAYQTEIDNLIENDFTGGVLMPENVDKARIRGIELAGGLRFDKWMVNGSLEFLEPENRSDGLNEGNVLRRRHQQSLRIDVDRQFQDFSLGASWQLVGRRYDDLENETRLGGYGLLDLRGRYNLTRDWTIQARLSNVLDKEYETAAGFEQADREFLFTVRYQPQ